MLFPCPIWKMTICLGVPLWASDIRFTNTQHESSQFELNQTQEGELSVCLLNGSHWCGRTAGDEGEVGG